MTSNTVREALEAAQKFLDDMPYPRRKHNDHMHECVCLIFKIDAALAELDAQEVVFEGDACLQLDPVLNRYFLTPMPPNAVQMLPSPVVRIRVTRLRDKPGGICGKPDKRDGEEKQGE